MTNDLPQFRRDPRFRPPSVKEQIPGSIPQPGDSMGHVAAYKFDDWMQIERVASRPRYIRVLMKCHGFVGEASGGEPCKREIEAVVFEDLFDPAVKYLCEDCIHLRGLAWGSTVEQSEYVHYQIVRYVGGDTLLRRLRHSPNFKDAMHKPMAIPNPLGRKPQILGGA